MAGPLDAPFLTLADTLLGVMTTGTAGGTSAAIMRKGGKYNPRDDSHSNAQPTTYPVVASPPQRDVIGDVKDRAQEAEKFIVIVAAKNLAIVPDDQTDVYVLNNEVFSISSVTPIYSGTQVCAYQLNCIR
jgi:hypothetical protein